MSKQFHNLIYNLLEESFIKPEEIFDDNKCKIASYKKGIVSDIIEKINNNIIIKETLFNNQVYNPIKLGMFDYERQKTYIFRNFSVIDFFPQKAKDIINDFCNYQSSNNLDIKKIYLKFLYLPILEKWLKNSKFETEKQKIIEISPKLNPMINMPQFLRFDCCSEEEVNQLIKLFSTKQPTRKTIVKKSSPKKSISNKSTQTKRRKRIPKQLRIDVWNHYIGEDKRKGNCYVCKKIIDITNFECGHNIADANGGETKLYNLRTICKGCNRSMGTMNLELYKETYYG